VRLAGLIFRVVHHKAVAGLVRLIFAHEVRRLLAAH